MPSIRRRSVLKTAGVLMASGILAGCATTDDTDVAENPPAGSLSFRNNHSVPHELSLEVLNVGTAVGDRTDGHHTVTGTPEVPVPERELTTTVVLDPGETQTYESVFRSRVWYDVRFTIDDTYPGEDLARTVFTPIQSGTDSTGRYLSGTVSRGGQLSWTITATDNIGPEFQ